MAEFDHSAPGNRLVYQEDRSGQSNPEACVIEKKMVTASTTLPLHLTNGGGYAIQFIKR